MHTENLWLGKHDASCELKDEAGFYPTEAIGKERIYKEKCTECNAEFIHWKVEMGIKDNHSYVKKELKELK